MAHSITGVENSASDRRFGMVKGDYVEPRSQCRASLTMTSHVAPRRSHMSRIQNSKANTTAPWRHHGDPYFVGIAFRLNAPPVSVCRTFKQGKSPPFILHYTPNGKLSRGRIVSPMRNARFPGGFHSFLSRRPIKCLKSIP